MLDESHKIKSGITRGLKKPGTRASGVLRLGMFGERRDILTGTPMPHGIMDIVSQSEFLYPHCGFREILEINEHNPGKPLQGLLPEQLKKTCQITYQMSITRKYPCQWVLHKWLFIKQLLIFTLGNLEMYH